MLVKQSIAAAAVFLGIASAAQAVVVGTATSSHDPNNYNSQIGASTVSNDLVLNGNPALTSIDSHRVDLTLLPNQYPQGGPTAPFNDGSIAGTSFSSVGNGPGPVGPSNPYDVVVDFKLANAAGYNISGITSYVSLQQDHQYTGDQAAQSFDIFVKTAANPTFQQVSNTLTTDGRFFYTNPLLADQVRDPAIHDDPTYQHSSAVTASDSLGGNIATGVTEIQIVYTGNNEPNGGSQNFSEIVVTGSVVPEPASLAMLAVGSIGLVARRRSRRA